MRITIVMASDEDGGLEKHVIELANGLAKYQSVSLIAHPRFQHLLNASVNFCAMDLSGSRHNPWTKYQLKKQILATQPDVVHAHASKTAKLMQGLVKKIQAPCVVTLHGDKSKLGAYCAFDHIITVSQRLAEKLPQTANKTVIYNGVELTQKAQPFHKNRKFIAIGRLNEVKGFDVLIEAWSDIPYVLSIVGDGEEQTKLQALIEHNGLTDRVKLLGFSDQVHQLLTEHEALIVSSRREGGPYTLSEALLLHRPVIGTDVGVMSEFIEADYLCKPDSAEALNAVIKQYLQLEAPEKEFDSAFTNAQHKLTFDCMIDQTLAVYQHCIEKGKTL
ncbi:glycosyltransferase [Acinetobacter bouvetii]|uniref:Teichuronic acid biosynthesis glycosyltransferase TuaC n=1 Tax=Acinetobacter bouvetii TaxID=202951 RepID=A0A811GCX1_9GAMM|nr:glycosyltransferase [Acinetobacter bouvetii]CAB1217438.1 Putative teichuronic acid biosynthesis glycosyltransferase TuaC [Acinetobacter bouvetii]